MVRGLVPSMVRCKGWAILSWWEDWFLPCHMWVMSHSDVIVGLVPTWSDVSAEPFWHWLSDVSADPFRHKGLVPCMVEYKCWSFLTLVVRCKCRAFWHGGLVPHMAKCKCWAFPTLVDWCECWAFLIGLWDLCYHMVRCECWGCLFYMIIELVPTWSSVSVGWVILT